MLVFPECHRLLDHRRKVGGLWSFHVIIGFPYSYKSSVKTDYEIYSPSVKIIEDHRLR